jgi:hypothetical protein
MHITVTFGFNVIFITIMFVERQNVVVKSSFLTLFKELKARTIFVFARGSSIPLFILQLIGRLSIIDVVRAKKTINSTF